LSADQEDDNKVFHYESGVPVFDVAHRVDSVERENEQSKKREEQYKRDQLKLNTVLVLFTAILAVVGLGGIGVSIWQAIIANTSANAAIRRGDAVMLIYQSGGVTLSMRTQAMQDAAVGQSVRLMNPSSNRVVLGVVTGPGAASASP